MKIHCISLQRAVDRREKILKCWKNFDVEFFDAIDKKFIEENGDIIPYSKMPRLILNTVRELNYGERACATSHYLLLKKLLETDEEWFYIIEDDVVPRCTPEFLEKDTLEMRKEFPNVELFLLHEQNSSCKLYGKIVNGQVTIPITSNKRCWGAWFYMISRRGALELMSYIETMELPVDLYWDKFMVNERIATIDNGYAYHNSSDTYIHPRLNNYIP